MSVSHNFFSYLFCPAFLSFIPFLLFSPSLWIHQWAFWRMWASSNCPQCPQMLPSPINSQDLFTRDMFCQSFAWFKFSSRRLGEHEIWISWVVMTFQWAEDKKSKNCGIHELATSEFLTRFSCVNNFSFLSSQQHNRAVRCYTNQRQNPFFGLYKRAAKFLILIKVLLTTNIRSSHWLQIRWGLACPRRD